MDIRLPLPSLWFFLVFLFSFPVFSQAPDAFNYQAVLRDAEGELLRSELVHLKVSVLSGGHGEVLDYAETHIIRTSDFGQVDLKIGMGLATKGVFSVMDWSIGSKWIKIDIDKNKDGDYHSLGQSRLLSVPYALYAKNVSGNSTMRTNSAMGENVWKYYTRSGTPNADGKWKIKIPGGTYVFSN